MTIHKMSLQEAILDALIDDSESIVQIEEYLKYLNISFNRFAVISLLNNLLKESLIYIVYPQTNQLVEPNILNHKRIEDFWFGVTEKGRSEWEKII